MKHLWILGLLFLFVAAASPAGPPPPKQRPRTPPALPILLPRLEHGRLDPNQARSLLNGPLPEAVEAARLRPAQPVSDACVELMSLDRPSIPDSIDVLHYDIRIDNVDETAKTFAALTTVRVKALQGLSRFDLDLASCVVDSVEVASLPGSNFVTAAFIQQSPVPDPSPQVLTIDLPQMLSMGDSLEARVHYRGTSGCLSVDGIFSGVVFSPVGVHSFSEPTYARHWYPSHDVPWDKATVSLSVFPDSGRVASASGVPAGQIQIDGRTYEHWETQLPISTYLNAFYLGDYVELQDSAPGGIPLQYFTYPALETYTEVDFENVPDMVAFYSTFFPYPYPRYAMSLGYFGGGMEHVMNSLIGYFFIRGDRSFEPLWAHELAHQWWGDLVTIGQWRDIWLNEGFATYFDLLYTEHHYGQAAMKASIAFTDSVYQARLDLLDHPILDPPLNDVFSFTVYNKGARVLDMLRGVSRLRLMTGPPAPPEAHQSAEQTGDARFNSIFTEYASRYRYGNVTTADFQQVAEEKLGENLDWFFDQWLNGRAYPTWRVDWRDSLSTGGSSVQVHIKEAPTDLTHFTVLLPVRYRSGDVVLDEVRTVGPDSSSWVVSLPPGQWSVELDPDNWVLDKTELHYTTVERQHITTIPVQPPVGVVDSVTHPVSVIPGVDGITVLPNPSASGFIIKATVTGTVPVPAVLSLHDLQGRQVRGMNFGTLLPGPIAFTWDGRADDGTRAASGIYFAQLSLGPTQTVVRLVLLR